MFAGSMRPFVARGPDREGILECTKFRETSMYDRSRLPNHRHASAAWALSSAGLDNDTGAPASLKRIAIALVIARAERAWRKETSGDFALTMAALDKGLRRAEERLGQFRKLTGRRTSAARKTEEAAT